jgi:hypothetical protein
MRMYQCGLIILNICTVSAGCTVCTQSSHFKYKLRILIYKKNGTSDIPITPVYTEGQQNGEITQFWVKSICSKFQLWNFVKPNLKMS